MNLPDPVLAIDRHPLTVSPDTPLLDILTKMNQVRGSQSNLLVKAWPNKQDDAFLTCSLNPGYSNYLVTSCALIVEKNKPIGIVTERDVVNLVAKGQKLGVAVAEVMTKQVITLAESDFKDVFVALSLMRQNQIRHLPIVDERGNLVGLITTETLRRVLQPVNLLTVRRVADVMTTQVIYAFPSTSVLDLAQLMVKHRVSCVAIVSEPNTSIASTLLFPLGIVTERDIVQLQILGLNMNNIPAEAVMSHPLFCLHPEDSLWLAHQEMQLRLVQRLVVTGRKGELVGIITQTNIVRAMEPIELYGAIDILQKVVETQTSQLIQVNEQLQNQAEEIRKALEKEQEINQIKSQFIYMMSHDFRNPLTSIIGLANLLELYGQQVPEDKQRQYLNCIVHSANRMLQMVESLLVIGKADAGKLEQNPVFLPLEMFSQELLSEFQVYEGSQHDLTFCYHGKKDAIVYCDEDMLRYILTNLISNAIKYSSPGSQVSLIVSVEEEQAIFQVKDRGIGIPPEYMQNLFKSFHRADNVVNIPGNGLGLAIVKKYLDLLNGEIVVESELGVGTTFTVKLPLNNQNIV